MKYNATRLSESGLNLGKGGSLETSSSRVLVVEDSEPFRKFICSVLGKRPELQIIGEVSDGLEAVQRAEELQPDLIVLDIGLPSLNGIEVARRVRKLSAESKILFVSQESSADVVQEALGTGADGYVVKTDAGRELLEAVSAFLRGDQFVSRRFSGHDFIGASSLQVAPLSRTEDYTSTALTLPRKAESPHRHEVRFYSDDEDFLDSFTQFIGAALNAGNAVIVVATESHRDSLLLRLEADGVDVAAAIKQGSYVPLDAADALVRLTVNDMPDPVRCREVIGDLVMVAAKGVKGEHRQVVVCGEIAPTLLSKGNAEGAIQLEHLWDEITEGYGVQTLCGYLWSAFPDRESSQVFRRICGEHSAVHGTELGY
jgi:DNA-binding NarL/FixJ family response regulator